MRHLSLGEIVDLHQTLLNQTGGATGLRDLGGLESAMAQPRATFDGVDLHPPRGISRGAQDSTASTAALIGMDSSPFVRGIMCRREGLGSTS